MRLERSTRDQRKPRNTRGVDAALERIRAVELIPGSELDRRQPERKTIRGHHETGVHQHPAGRIVAGLAATYIYRDRLEQPYRTPDAGRGSHRNSSLSPTAGRWTIW